MTGASRHPLDQLSREEIEAAAAACLGKAADLQLSTLRFNTISCQEPGKAALLQYEAGLSPELPRLAFCILQAPPVAPVIEALVDVTDPANPSIQAWTEKQGVQPLLSIDDCFEVEEVVKADARVQELLAARGITDMDMVACDPWSIHMAPQEGHGNRLLQSFLYLRMSAHDNQYAHPLDLTPIVDLDKRQVIQIDLPYGDAIPAIPMLEMNYHRKLVEDVRRDIKPLDVVQRLGPSFSVDGNLINWQKWRMRISFNYREGLVLHNVGYEDGGRLRPILHRASVVEMTVPYADPHAPFHRKCAFDAGENGLGYCTNSLALGCDCLGAIHYFDAIFSNSKGQPFELSHAVCLHEEDAGILWKHVEYRSGHAETRRSRRLVLQTSVTLVHYEYLFYWYFYQDGTIEHEVKLTGELSTHLLSPGEEEPGFGTLVAPGVNAHYHQHQFCVRLDFALDDADGGAGLNVSEVDVEVLSVGPDNPYGNAFRIVETLFDTEKQAQRLISPLTNRVWKVNNPQSRHLYTGKPIAYKLVPSASPPLLAAPGSATARLASFAAFNLWVTPHSDEERWPAADYTLCSNGDPAGLEAFTMQDRYVGSGSDPVIWYTYGVTHIPRPEDFPVMPVERVGFKLKPFGFFTTNPSTDLPAVCNKASMVVGGGCRSFAGRTALARSVSDGYAQSAAFLRPVPGRRRTRDP